MVISSYSFYVSSHLFILLSIFLPLLLSAPIANETVLYDNEADNTTKSIFLGNNDTTALIISFASEATITETVQENPEPPTSEIPTFTEEVIATAATITSEKNKTTTLPEMTDIVVGNATVLTNSTMVYDLEIETGLATVTFRPRTTKRKKTRVTRPKKNRKKTNEFGRQGLGSADPESLDNIELGGTFIGQLLNPVIVDYQYVVIIDGGSSHTDIYVYKWSSDKVNGTGVVAEESKLVCDAVLSNFKDNPTEAGENLGDCLDFAKKTVPETKWKSTKILLGATAGMRVLNAHNASIATAIFHSVHSYINEHYDFIAEVKDIGILSPANEGGFSWLSINYAKGILQANAELNNNSRKATWGSLDLGGASTQFSVEISDILENRHLPHIEFLQPTFSAHAFGHNYQVYTKSFLCYGKNEAFRRYKATLMNGQNFSEPIIDQCRPEGYETTVNYFDHFEKPCSNYTAPTHHFKDKYLIRGGGNGDKCLNAVRNLFEQTMDLNPSLCPFQDGECSFSNKTNTGDVRGKFLGTGALYYDTKNVKILSNDSFSLSPFDAAGYRAARHAICQKTHDQVRNFGWQVYYNQVEQLITARPELKRFFIRQCFDATYTEVLLHDVYKLSDKTLKDMVFAKNIDGVDIGWTLGWALVSSADNNP